MQLSIAQRNEIADNGFTVIRGAVAPVQVNTARRVINHSLGEGIPREEMTKFRAQTYCRELCETPPITDLFNGSPLSSLVESALGEGNVPHMNYGQIALRFPIMADPPPAPGPHMDGLYTPHNGVTEGTVANFTALVGIYLSDVPEENMGNFTVWPGSHITVGEYIKQGGFDILLEGQPRIDWGEPYQVCGQAGDAVIAHYMLGHGISSNVSPSIRYATFFRIKHRAHEEHSVAALTDMWLAWEGLRSPQLQNV